MTAPVAAKITLPDDSGNSGKNIRTITKTVGADSVHSQFWVPDLAMTLAGKYFIGSSQQTVQETVQNGTSTGFFWFQLPTAATVSVLIRRIGVDFSANAAGVALLPPVVAFTKFTFTGTASGAQAASPNAVMPYQTGGAAAQFTARTAVTGMTPTLVSNIASFTLPNIMTAVGEYGGQRELLPNDPFAWQRGHNLEIAPGEGIVVYQQVAGSASDPRRFAFQMEWLEIDLA